MLTSLNIQHKSKNVRVLGPLSLYSFKRHLKSHLIAQLITINYGWTDIQSGYPDPAGFPLSGETDSNRIYM